MFTPQRDLALGVTIQICDLEITFDRSLENLRRVESAVGAAGPFSVRLDARGVSHAEIARVYCALLRGVPNAPSQPDIDAWVFKAGSRHGDLAQFVYSLTLGSEELDVVMSTRNLLAGKPTGGAAAEAERARPFVPADEPTGQPSSGLDTASVSLRERLTSRASTSSPPNSRPMWP